MSDGETSGTKRIALLSVAGVALAAAVVLGVLRGGGSDQLDDPAMATPYVCVLDGHEFHLTPAGFEQHMKAGLGTPLADTGEVRGAGVAGIRCPECGKSSAVIVNKCPKDGTLVPSRTKENQPGKCPKCGTDPTAAD